MSLNGLQCIRDNSKEKITLIYGKKICFNNLDLFQDYQEGEESATGPSGHLVCPYA